MTMQKMNADTGFSPTSPRRAGQRRAALLRLAYWTLALATLLALAAPKLSAFTLTDHAVNALIRFYPVVASYEAEDMAPAAAVDDKLAANGRAVLLKADNPRLTFTRKFTRSTYTVWCIARSDGKPSERREPMYVQLFLKGPNGLKQQWRMRINYQQTYQDVAHLYFDVNIEGDYELSFCQGPGSQFNLLVDRLEVRDVLARTYRKGFKTSASLFNNPVPPQGNYEAPTAAQAIALARDYAASFPPRNAIITAGGMDTEGFYYEFSLDRFNVAETGAENWVWKMATPLEKPWVLSGPVPQMKDEMDALVDGADEGGKKEIAGAMQVEGAVASKSFGVPPKGDPHINWAKAKLSQLGQYTAADYYSFKAAPSRWPDDGGGFFIAQKDFHTEKNLYFNWMAAAFQSRFFNLRLRIIELADRYYNKGDQQAGFQAALLMAFFADIFPSIDHTVQGTMNTIWGDYPFNDFSGRHVGEFGKFEYSGWAGPNNLPVIIAYDRIFPIIKDNQVLAQAIGSQIPWVKTPQDVIELLDVKLVQHFYDVCTDGQVRAGPGIRCDPLVAIIQGDNPAGREMLNKIINVSDFQFPALLDSLVVRHSRDSTSFIGSMFYAKGPSLDAGLAAADISHFAQIVKDKSIDLADPQKSSIIYQAAQWLIEPYVVGVHINGVGDVSGPHGYPTMDLGDPLPYQRLLHFAFERWGDPRFAWVLANVIGCPPDANDAQRKVVAEAAQKFGRDPRVGQPSRSLGGFGVSILELGGDKPDFKQRSGVVMRTGYGAGHSHGDQLNLEIFAKGLIFGPEFGGRGGYGNPGTSEPQCHNLVAVDGRVSNTGRTTVLADLPGAPFAAGVGGNVRRFISLVDAGGSDSYIFDVVRASGGKQRTYYFHGQQTMPVDPEAVARESATAAPTGGADMSEFLDDLESTSAAGKPVAWKWNQNVFSHNLAKNAKGICPEVFQAVWPMDREMEQNIFNRILDTHRFANGKKPSELFEPHSGRKFTRLILLNSKGRAMRSFEATSRQVGYRIDCVGVSEEKPAEQVSVFPAVIEMFEKEAFITAVKALSPPESATAAAEVTVGKDRRDLFCQNPDAAASAKIQGSKALELTGLFGFASYDGKGLRAASLVEGTKLQSGDVAIELPAAYYQAKITACDFVKHLATLDQKLPSALLAQSYFRMGGDEELFRISELLDAEGKSVLHFEKTAESYRSPVLLQDGQDVTGMLEPEHIQKSGYLTDETGKHGWRVTGTGNGEVRWLGDCFRGGATCGYAISDADVVDANGDGKGTLTFAAGDAWEEPMIVEVVRVVPESRLFLFRPLNSPKGYSGTRSYSGRAITNEKGNWCGITMMPGKLGCFTVEGSVQASAFTDADGDGMAKFSVYYFGPGDNVVLPRSASILRQEDGTWRLTTNSPVVLTLPGAKVEMQDRGGAWQALAGTAVGASVRVELNEAQLGDGRVLLRAQ